MGKYRWLKIDTASIMFSALSSKDWGRTFRFSAYFKEDIDPEAVKRACEELRPYYPSVYMYLKRGFFWNYLAASDKLPEIRKADGEGMRPIVLRRDGRPDFRITYTGKRLSIECSHSLGDGKGILIFFRTLLARYNELRHGETGEYITKEDPDANIRNAFADYYDKNGEKLRSKNFEAFHFPEVYEENYLNLLFAEMKVHELKELAHKENMTVTEYLTAVLILGIIRSTKEPITKPVTIAVPVNLRRFFSTMSLRNFTVQSYITFCPEGRRDITLREIIDATRGQLKKQLTKEHLIKSVNKFGALVNNPVLRVVPNFIKLPVMRKMSLKSHSEVTTIFTNYGACELDEALAKSVEKLQFVNGDTRKYGLAVTCSCIGYKDVLSMCFSRSNKDTCWYDACIDILKNEGLQVDVTHIEGKAKNKKYSDEGFREAFSAERIKAYFNI